jgi:hypothetical protein
MDNNYILNISIINAIGRTALLKYLLVLALEIAACVYLTSRNDRDRQRALRWRTLGVVAGLSVLGLFIYTPSLACLWFMAVVAVTGVFASTRLGFGDDAVDSTPTLKIATPFRNLVVWWALVLLSFTLSVGGDLLVTIYRGPHIEQRQVWFITHEEGGNLLLAFKDGDDSFSVRVKNDYTSYFTEDDCLEMTYYAPYDPLGFFFQNFATQIRASDQCP